MWTPTLSDSDATITARLLDALRRDIASGALPPATRLPTHRDLAHHLGIGIGTVTGVYAEATRLGLIDARVGRGSFVRATPPALPDGPIALSHNVPPSMDTDRHLARALADIARRPNLSDLIGYAPAEGWPADRAAGAAWLQRTTAIGAVDPARLIVTSGAQQAMAIAFAVLCRPGDVVLTEAATFFGMKTLAQQGGYRLHGLAMDAEGITPDALDRACTATGARVLYTMPTLQNPTGRIMGPGRRQAIAAIARRHGLWIVEDDIYAAFATAPPPLATLMPDRTLYIGGVSKALCPGLRTGYLLAPDADLYTRIGTAIRAMTYAPCAIGTAVATRWIEDGTADRIVAAAGIELRARNTLAADALGDALEPPADPRCPHLWLPMSELDAERMAARALRGDVAVTPPSGPVVDPALASGIRLCIGAPADRNALARALTTLAAALAPAGTDASLALV